MTEQNREQEERLQSLEEARDNLDAVESIIIEIISSNSLDVELFKSARRCLHNNRGIASLIPFPMLDELSHLLEQALKALEIKDLDTRAEALLLGGIDCIRQVINLNRQGIAVDEEWLKEHGTVFEELQKLLQSKFSTETLQAFKGSNKGQVAVELRISEDLNEHKDQVQKAFQELEEDLAHLKTKIDSLGCEAWDFTTDVAVNYIELGQKLQLNAWKKLSQSVLDKLEESRSNPEQVVAISAAAIEAWQRSRSLIMNGQLNDLPTEFNVKGLAGNKPAIELPKRLPPEKLHKLIESVSQETKPNSEQESTVRIPVRQLNKLNELCEELLIDQYSIEQNLEQIQNIMLNLSNQVQILERSNTELRFAYDKVSSQKEKEPLLLEQIRLSDSGLDTLQMDRFSNLDILSMEVMESSVRIQEIHSDTLLNLEELAEIAGRQKRNLRQMQAKLAQTRLCPLSDLLNRFPRVLRELSLMFGKKVSLHIEGGEILVDRSILEALGDPLIHLLRNAFDHGIEQADIREAHGKLVEGKIKIKAYRSKDQIAIAVSDDGGGIDIEKVRLRAMQNNLLSEEQVNSATTADLLNLISEPGFTTADEASSLSGQGIGLDVVKTNLRFIRGNVRVDTQPGSGTTFTLTVPFTLSLVQVVLVESSGFLLAFPTDAIEKTIKFDHQQIFPVSGSYTKMLRYNGSLIVLFQLSDWLQFPINARHDRLEGAPDTNTPDILILAQGTKKIALQVDRLSGEREVTIRQVADNIMLPIGFRGCTILGNGKVVPLVNSVEIFEYLTSGGELCQKLRLPQIPSTKLISQLSLDNQIQDTSSFPDNTKSKLILIVDDSRTVRNHLASVLQKANFRIEEARDGQEALDKLLSGLCVDAIVCDIEMPRLNGYELLNQLQQYDSLNQIPVAMLTSRSGETHQQIAFELGAKAYFTKPYNEHNLLTTLNELIVS